MRRLLVIFVFFLLLPLFTGCATVKELPKKIWGSSTQALEQARKDGVSKTFDLDYESSFNKVVRVLEELGCHIHIKDKRRHLIVAMHFQGADDTTELGIFFAEKDSQTTEIELSCLSSSLLNYASEKIFSMMDKIDENKEEEVE